MPISIAVQIANGKDGEVSEALSEAYETGQLRGTKLAAARRLIAKRIEKRQKDGKAEEARRKVTGNMLVQVYKQRVREGPAAASKKLQATSIAARSMLEEENEFLLRDLRSVEEPYGTDILTLTVACGYLRPIAQKYQNRALSGPTSHRYPSRFAEAAI